MDLIVPLIRRQGLRIVARGLVGIPIAVHELLPEIARLHLVDLLQVAPHRVVQLRDPLHERGIIRDVLSVGLVLEIPDVVKEQPLLIRGLGPVRFLPRYVVLPDPGPEKVLPGRIDAPDPLLGIKRLL